MPSPIKFKATIEEIIQHDDTVKTLILGPEKKCPNFKPGQFLHLAIDDYDPCFHWPESRVFSIANSPTRRGRLRIVFSVKGEFTRRMFDNLNAGDTIWLKMPYGNFTFHNDSEAIVLIAGGTGITPFISFLEYAVDRGLDSSISLFYGVRNPRLLIFDSFLKECGEALKRFSYNIFVESHSGKLNSMKVREGMLSIGTIFNETSRRFGATYYLSGPQSMIVKFRNELSTFGITQNKIMIDEWE